MTRWVSRIRHVHLSATFAPSSMAGRSPAHDMSNNPGAHHRCAERTAARAQRLAKSPWHGSGAHQHSKTLPRSSPIWSSGVWRSGMPQRQLSYCYDLFAAAVVADDELIWPGCTTNGRLIGRLELKDVQHLAGPCGLSKPSQQGLLLCQRHVLALTPANRLRLKRSRIYFLVQAPHPCHFSEGK